MSLRLALACTLALACSALALPARAAEEPTVFMNTQTARTLPAGRGMIALGGAVLPRVGLTGVVGLPGELELLIGLGYVPDVMTMPGNNGLPLPKQDTFGVGAGFKKALFAGNTWNGALVCHFNYSSVASFQYGAYAALPLGRSWGPGELTLSPRLSLPDLSSSAADVGRANGATLSLQASYFWPLLPWLALMGEVAPGYHITAGPSVAPRLGLRLTPTPKMALELAAGADQVGAGTYPAFAENVSFLSASVRYGF